MSSEELAQSLDAIRELAPVLNAASDKANAAVKMVEEVLIHETAIGVSASRAIQDSRHRIEDDDGNTADELIQESLVFGRVNGTYRICIEQTTYRRDDDGEFADEVDSFRTPWSRCDRETRLRAFGGLPELLEGIAIESARLAEVATATVAKVGELGTK